MLAELESVWARGGCVLCDSAEFEREGFGRQTVLICDQCEREFHVGCLHDHNMAELSELPKGVCPEGIDHLLPPGLAAAAAAPHSERVIAVHG